MADGPCTERTHYGKPADRAIPDGSMNSPLPAACRQQPSQSARESEGGFCVSAINWLALTSCRVPGGERSTRRLFLLSSPLCACLRVRCTRRALEACSALECLLVHQYGGQGQSETGRRVSGLSFLIPSHDECNQVDDPCDDKQRACDCCVDCIPFNGKPDDDACEGERDQDVLDVVHVVWWNFS